MGTLLTIAVFASALFALLAGISALKAFLSLRRTRDALRSRLRPEVSELAQRTARAEKNLAALDARAQALPVRVGELQQNLATLRVLTNALGASLRQTEKVVTPTGLRSSFSGPLSRAVKPHGGTGPTTEEGREESVRP